MPSEGQQQVYGAQHPPNIKLIKELNLVNSSAASTNHHHASSSISTTNSSGAGAVGNSFRDFEKKTYDVWDLDDEDDDYDARLNPYSLPISITDSEEMAKKIIRNHKESQEKSLSKQSSHSSFLTDQTKTKPGGPGKALRQDNSNNSNITTNPYESYKKYINNVKNNNSNSSNQNFITNNNDESKNVDSLESTMKSTNLNPTIIEAKLDNNKTITTTTKSISTSNLNNNSHNTTSSSYAINKDKEEDLANIEKFKKILDSNPINLEELQKASWKGIPKIYRPVCWKLLSDYLPLKKELQEKTIETKRNAYWESVSEHYTSIYLETHHEMLRQILNDIPRMNPLIPIFQKQIVQNIFQRVLYVWAVRHPASGYVQGINDLLTPFFTVFLTEYSEINTEIQNVDIENLPQENLRQLEADSYWCMNKLLERIQENYVFSQPGIQRNIQSLEDLIKRIDKNLYTHLKQNGLEFIQFAFRWMNNLLMREIPLNCTIRLWDTYHAEPFGFSDFHLYVCAAFLLRYSRNLIEEKDFQGLMLLLQNLPTKNMKANDIALLTAEAYKLQVMFANSPNHISTVR